MIQAILFDAGGVLITEGSSGKRLQTFDRLLGWEPGTMHLRLYSGGMWEALSTGAIDPDTYWEKVGLAWEKRLPQDFKLFIDNFHAHRLDFATLELARRLRRHYRLVLISNATVLLPAFLAHERRLHGLFDIYIISALEGVRKPDPRIYEIALARLQLPAANCVLIDDKERNNLIAEALGMKTIEHRGALQTESALRQLGVKF